ncbi:aminomethyltransferase, putative [Plasmodium gallinaceum]|uniref:Aminomethyltransferase, putative n=1 Tax=Plasmodium gallinaceum TaxID=5849 RepID=A0A1J1GQA4_PLAGA|nr:aminomethyltransferase, putative [Plasmodium gallinaceum]CRG94717.1 aminomethyltransferase, putative [Plasmodium gallinaceum]
MNKSFICKLKNRTLIQIWGNDSFKFLQSLTTNDLSKIIKEDEFILNKNFPKNILANNFDRNIYKVNYTNKKYKELIIGLPSLFLLNNGKILFDCFIYNVKYIYETKSFSLFYIDCNSQILKRLLDVLEKRKLSCDVYFKELKNINIYQLLPCISLLHNYNNKNISSSCIDLLNTFESKGSFFFFSKDERSDILGYRIYEITDKTKNKDKNIDKNKNNNENINDIENTKKNRNMVINEKMNNVINSIFCKFQKQEKLELRSTFIYEYFKLNLGIIENLYLDHTFFKDSTLNDINYKTNNDIKMIENNLKTGKRTKITKDIFIFKDLSPFDLNYDKLNYLANDKGCYVGQESINRIRNEIFINKYELSFCINYDYYDLYVNHLDNLSEKMYNDFIYKKYLKEINDKHLLKSSFFLLKNLIENQENIINYQDQYNIFIENSNENNDSFLNNIIGNVFFYNNIMGLCFLIKKKIQDIKKDIYSSSINIYIKNKVNERKQRILFVPFKFHNTFINAKKESY